MAVERFKIDSDELESVRTCVVELSRGSGSDGRPVGLTRAEKIVVERDVTNGGSTVGFVALTNANGTRKYVSIQFEQTGANGNVLCTHSLSKAHVSEWTLFSRPAADGSLQVVERIVFCSGITEMSAGGQRSSFELAPYTDIVQ